MRLPWEGRTPRDTMLMVQNELESFNPNAATQILHGGRVSQGTESKLVGGSSTH